MKVVQTDSHSFVLILNLLFQQTLRAVISFSKRKHISGDHLLSLAIPPHCLLTTR
jgi:hypothetical protein